MPIFFFEVPVFRFSIIVKPLFDTNPAAVLSIVTADSVGGFIGRLAFILSDGLSLGTAVLRQNLPGYWSFD